MIDQSSWWNKICRENQSKSSNSELILRVQGLLVGSKFNKSNTKILFGPIFHWEYFDLCWRVPKTKCRLKLDRCVTGIRFSKRPLICKDQRGIQVDSLHSILCSSLVMIFARRVRYSSMMADMANWEYRKEETMKKIYSYYSSHH